MTNGFRRVAHRLVILFGSAALSASAPHVACADCVLSSDPTAGLWETLALADQCREAGDYRADDLYRRAIELEPDNPWALEAYARYLRVYRGARGLFAKSEAYYLLAEAAVEQALARARSAGEPVPKDLLDIREQTIRGRVELNKPEGLGLLIPKKPEQKLGIYLAHQVEYGTTSLSHHFLETQARKILNKWPDFDTRTLLRKPIRFGLRTRLRVRYGSLPYLDVGWRHAHVVDAFIGDDPPYAMWDLNSHDLELAAEDVVGFAPAGDLLWRLEYHRVRAKEENYLGDEIDDFDRIEKTDRLTAATTLTRSFGRLKVNIEALGSYAWVDRWWDQRDHAYTVGGGLWVLRFPDLATTERWPIDPRAQEYRIGVVRETQGFADSGDHDGDDVLNEEMVSTTFYAALKLTELVPRTDVQFFLNWFELDVTGAPPPRNLREEGGNVEINLILTHRIVDWVNDLRVRQVDWLAGLALWTASLRLFDEESTHALDDFENWGGGLASALEVFSVPANRSTLILEAGYEVRNYHRLNDVQHLFKVALRFGF